MNNKCKDLLFLDNTLLRLENIIDTNKKYNKADVKKILKSLLLIADDYHKSKAISDEKFKTYYDRVHALTIKIK